MIAARPLWLIVLAGCGAAYPVTERAAEVIPVTTADGWRLAVHHYPPTAGPKRRTPVLLCHGIASNRHNWDLTDRLSFPAYLARHGFDTYVLELRGGGESEKPGLFDAHGWDYTVDDYILRDLPAAIDAVAARGETGQVHWVGHSMGGIVMYGYLQRVGPARVRSVIAAGSPALLFDHNPWLFGVLDLYPFADWLFDELPLGSLAGFGAPLAWPSRVLGLHLVWNEANLSADTARRLAANATENISSAAVAQFIAARDGDGHLRSADGTWDYTAGMARVTAPVFFVAGGQDNLAPPVSLLAGYTAVASTEKRIEILSQANGFAHDYGHLDMVVGETAPDEIYPMLADWIGAHD